MAMFSERNGYVKPNQVIIKDTITKPIINSIHNCFWQLRQNYNYIYKEVSRQVWVYFLNNKEADFYYLAKYEDIILTYIEDSYPWYKKLDLIEFVLLYFQQKLPNDFYDGAYNDVITYLNSEFERHNYAYRIIDKIIVEVTSNIEITSIDEALQNPIKGVQIHLQTALKHLSVSQQEPDYRNSIKESISAVEACCRNITKKNTLGDALAELEKNGVVINEVLKKSFNLLYAYTNGKDGIRHAILEGGIPPTNDEAIYMLVACSAFVNYLTKKNITKS